MEFGETYLSSSTLLTTSSARATASTSPDFASALTCEQGKEIGEYLIGRINRLGEDIKITTDAKL
jgi:hypothetical protein